VRPADTVSITVSAHPASYVGLLAVDQSVLLLEGGNDITEDSVSCFIYLIRPPGTTVPDGLMFYP